MKFTRIFLCVTAALAVLTACQKGADNNQPVPSSPTRIRLEVGLSDHFTKATGVSSNSAQGESKVNTLQVFVFNGDALDGYRSSNSNTATVSCSAGERDIYCVVNVPDISVTSKTDLLAQVAQLSESPSSFGMIGHKSETLAVDGSVTVDVYRFAGRVVIKSIKNALENAAQADNFRLDAVYLTNVAGDVDFGKDSEYEVTQFYNRQGFEENNNLGSFTNDVIGNDLAANATYSTPHYFYTMPNAYNLAVGGEWTPRGCRLVIKATIDGVVNYYPIPMPVIEGCKSYEIDCVTITRPGNPEGSPDPEEGPIEGFDQGFEVNVIDWDLVLLGDNGNITI